MLTETTVWAGFAIAVTREDGSTCWHGGGGGMWPMLYLTDLTAEGAAAGVRGGKGSVSPVASAVVTPVRIIAGPGVPPPTFEPAPPPAAPTPQAPPAPAPAFTLPDVAGLPGKAPAEPDGPSLFNL